ncbi:MAG: S8 family peptidase [Patescibacteria group bacterium]
MPNYHSNASFGETDGRYIVVFKDSVADSDSAGDEMAGKHGFAKIHNYNNAIKGFAARIPAAKLKIVKSDSRVAFVSEDKIVSIADNKVSAKGGKPAPEPQPSQIIPSGVNRIDAENKTNKGAGVEVAVIDTGIDLKHPDLQANIAGGKNCSTGKSYSDGNGHGTHVAGSIAALNNSIGVVGVAPEAKLWSVRVLDNSGSGTWSSVICGLDFVTANASRIKVANMSLGGAGSSDNNCGNTNSDALHKAICRARDAGVAIVVAAGNSGADASGSVPAAYDDAVITVSALADSDGQPGGLGAATSYGPDDTFASFSNYGSAVDLGAPGVDIYSTWKGGAYNTISGTSMASPHVAGAAALYLAANPGASWIQVRDGLKTLGENIGFGHSDPSGLHPEPVVLAGAL